MPANLFSSVALRETLQSVLREMRFEHMTPIQAASLPILLTGADFIGSSPTGSGKTAAFVLPILEQTDWR